MRRTLIELLHLGAGLIATWALASMATWAVPGAAGAIGRTALACGLAVILMSYRPLREAWRADRGRAAEESVHG